MIRAGALAKTVEMVAAIHTMALNVGAINSGEVVLIEGKRAR